MKLFYSNNSPYARKIRILIDEKKASIILEKVVLADKNCIIHKYNPLSKVPTLFVNDISIFDSPVIAEYVDHKSGPLYLIPGDFDKRMLLKRWEAIADGLCDAAVAIMLEKRRISSQQNTDVFEKQMRKIKLSLTWLNEEMKDKEYYLENTFSYADIAVGSALGYVKLRYPEIDFKEEYLNLHRLYELLMQRPSFQMTAPEPYL
ncbi:MAG: glutathione S-transferase N-terminal domain-containing protein [Candidatus Methylopumilus sp.]|nr:glutathione S-transferase N-terminal domain-containing protein [Candidatus Methylopumilus sp.]